MEANQSFRLVGTTHVEKIPCDQVGGVNVIFWDEVEQVFPGAKHVRNGNITVKMMRDSNHSRLEPLRIQHLPGVVLDVVSSANVGGGSIDPPLANTTPSQVGVLEISLIDEDTESLSVAPTLASLGISGNRANTSFSNLSSTVPPNNAVVVKGTPQLQLSQVVNLAQRKALESEIEQQLMSSFSTDIQNQARASSVYGSMVQAIKDGQVGQSDRLISYLLTLKAQNAELTGRVADLLTDNNRMAAQMLDMQASLDAKQDEMKQLQVQALSQLALLHKQVQAVLTQTYELHEYPIPRLFVVLPQDHSRWDYLNPFANRFRLYFLCECGEHTRSANSKMPHHIHLAKHEGYEIARPSEFFEQYGSYVLTILRMLKFGISVAGVVVPAIPDLFLSDAIDQVTKDLDALKGSIGSGIDQAINYIEKGSYDFETTDPMGNNEELEGVDLRKLDTFLKNKDENKVLGNLYRTVTGEGHVKWVCIDHYRENYQAKTIKLFRLLVISMEGLFDENVGRVEVDLHSRAQAEQFYSALEKAKSVYELKIDFNWELTYNDLKDLQSAIYKTNVGVLEIPHLRSTDSVGDLLNRLRQFNPIFDMMRHSSIRSMVLLVRNSNFFTRSDLLSRKEDFPNLRHLEIDLRGVLESSTNIAFMLSKARNLDGLTLIVYKDQILSIVNAMEEKWACEIVFKTPENTRLVIPIPSQTKFLFRSGKTIRDMAQMFWACGAQIEAWDMNEFFLDVPEMEAARAI
ncbi:hypothetical protein BGX31_001123, partial [Mortierella sp. GBA43]